MIAVAHLTTRVVDRSTSTPTRPSGHPPCPRPRRARCPVAGEPLPGPPHREVVDTFAGLYLDAADTTELPERLGLGAAADTRYARLSGSINWYRNLDRNWHLLGEVDPIVEQPA